MKVIALALLLFTAGCKKDGTGEQGTGIPVDVAGVNALVPAALKDKLVFEQRELVDDFGSKTTKFTLAAPKGWKHEERAVGVQLDSPGTALGFGTEMKLGKDCDGLCESKNWAEVFDKRVKGMDGKVQKDVKGATNRLVITESLFGGSTKTELVFAWWGEDQPQYWTCTVRLDDEAKAALPAFEKACQGVGLMVTRD
ncbi:MAG: hypothetical protein H0T46_30400 [Deltaproteobacteria bacterium]|nr:hypothetical protein [Deltaproteobacteria bacterium]